MLENLRFQTWFILDNVTELCHIVENGTEGRNVVQIILLNFGEGICKSREI